MEAYVKESLYVLDYNNNKVDAIFLSDDHITPGYAYSINIKEENTGYSDLRFSMPYNIIDENGNNIHNPKLKLLVPLVKLRYERTITYTGDKEISVQEPIGYGDNTTYIEKIYKPTYPDNIIEHYVMDYIVQPLDRQRSNLKTDPNFTAIDYPRFNLSKKKVGLEITDYTVTHDDWSLYTGEPYSVDGTIKYVKWTQAMSDNCYLPGYPAIPVEFNAKNASSFPLCDEHFQNLNVKAGQWPYGYNGTAFYWPVSETGRFKGKMFKKGDYLVLRMYDFYDGVKTENNIVPSVVWDNTRYSWNWDQLLQTDSYLSPNNALNYLRYVLENTNWSIALKDDGTPDVDIEKIEVPTPAGSTTNTELKDNTCQLSLSGSNCYNAITAICQGLQLYPIFDCENRTVSLRLFAGKNYGLTYSLGQNLITDAVKMDGEKVITKLYVSGGKDYNGDSNIHIGDATREFTAHSAGFYKSSSSLPKTGGYIYAIVDTGFSDSDFLTTVYDNKLNTKIVETHGSLVKDYWKVKGERSVWFYNNTTSNWSQGTLLITGNWKGTVNGVDYIVDPISGAEGEWNPNDDIYINQRSPWGTNYIMNLKWSYQNGWITKEQILGLYQINQKVNDLNAAFVDKYTEDRLATQQEYNEAKNNYDISQDEYESTINNMMAKYYNNNDDYSEGTTRCFHVYPKDVYEVKTGDKTYEGHIRMFHCYKCGATSAYTNGQSEYLTCPKCGATGDTINNDYITIHKYGDYKFKYTEDMYLKTRYEGYQYNPHVKGTFLRLVTTLDCKDKSSGESKGYTIQDYESMISIVSPIGYRGSASSTFDGYDYVINDVYVKSSSGQIENWNESITTYINAYGKALDYYEEVKVALEKIEQLNELYKKWASITDSMYSEIQEKYGDYIVEGDYKNDEQPYVGLLFKEGLEASDKFSTPEITYTLDVIDSSGLMEYRLPMAGHYICRSCGYANNLFYSSCPECGSENFIKTVDTYNDLVHSLHNIGQIVPHAGDYCQVYDEKMGLFGIPALITEIERVIDQPVNNKIRLDTSYTDDETLVGNIITATNTVLNNTDIYARTAVLKSDGTMDSDSIKNTLENASGADINIVGTNGSILLNGSGLRATDPNDPNRGMKYSGNGIFCTTNLQPDSGEAITWDKLMTPTGINANYINAGTIDAQKVNIMSGLSGKVILDQYGLAVKQNTEKGVRLEKFDPDSAKNNANYASDWGTRTNVSSFIGVDTSNKPLIYTKGFLVAEEGSNIANWITSNNGFYHLSGEAKDVILSPNGLDGYLLKVKDKFTVDADGNTYIKGKIIVDTTDSSMNIGTVGGWTASSSGLKVTGIELSPTGGTSHTVNKRTGSDWAIWANDNFGVTTNGNLYATSVDLSGKITATSGNIGGLTIESDRLYMGDSGLSSNTSCYAFWAGETNGVHGAANSNGKFRVGHDGGIYATKGTIGNCTINDGGDLIVPSGHVSGTFSATKIKGDVLSGCEISIGNYFSVSKTGQAQLSNKVGFITLGIDSKHPWISGINVNKLNGIHFMDGEYQSDVGDQKGYIGMNAQNNFSITNKTGGNMNFTTGGSIGFSTGDTGTASVTGTYIRIGSTSKNAGINVYGNAFTYNGANVQTALSSTLSVKDNVILHNTSDVLDIISKIDMYDYNYTVDSLRENRGYGYIIDYLHTIPNIDKYLDFAPSEIDGIETEYITHESMLRFLLTAIIELNKHIKKESE